MSANYITINSTFEPDDYKTMLEEAKDMTAQQQALEDKMTEQRTGMAALKQTANTPYARALLDQFETHLNNASDSLSRNGLSMQTRAMAKDLIPLFSQTVLPVSTAVAAKDAMVKAQENDIKEGKDTQFDRKANDISLDEFIKNPSLTYDSQNLDNITNNSAKVFENIKNVLRSSTGGRNWMNEFGNYYMTRLNQYGLKPAEIMKGILRDPNAPTEIKVALNNLYQAQKSYKWGNQFEDDRAWEAIARGMWFGLAKPEITDVKDEAGLDALKAARAAKETVLPKESLTRLYYDYTTDDKNKGMINDINTLYEYIKNKADGKTTGEGPYLKGGLSWKFGVVPGSNPVYHYIISKANVNYANYNDSVTGKVAPIYSATVNGKKIYFQNVRHTIDDQIITTSTLYQYVGMSKEKNLPIFRPIKSRMADNFFDSPAASVEGAKDGESNAIRLYNGDLTSINEVHQLMKDKPQEYVNELASEFRKYCGHNPKDDYGTPVFTPRPGGKSVNINWNAMFNVISKVRDDYSKQLEVQTASVMLDVTQTLKGQFLDYVSQVAMSKPEDVGMVEVNKDGTLASNDQSIGQEKLQEIRNDKNFVNNSNLLVVPSGDLYMSYNDGSSVMFLKINRDLFVGDLPKANIYLDNIKRRGIDRSKFREQYWAEKTLELNNGGKKRMFVGTDLLTKKKVRETVLDYYNNAITACSRDIRKNSEAFFSELAARIRMRGKAESETSNKDAENAVLSSLYQQDANPDQSGDYDAQ
jgi:hypothetical protein